MSENQPLQTKTVEQIIRVAPGETRTAQVTHTIPVFPKRTPEAVTRPMPVIGKVTEPSGHPDTASHFNELTRKDGPTTKKIPNGYLVDGHPPQFTDFNRCARNVAPYMSGPSSIFLDGELEQLAELQRQGDEIQKTMSQFGLHRTNDIMAEHRKNFQQAVVEGKSTGIIPSREDVQKTQLVGIAGCRAQLLQLTHEKVVPLCRPILERYFKILREQMEDLEFGDRELAESWGMVYRPSLIWRGLASVAMRFIPEKRIPSADNWGTPNSILDGLVRFEKEVE